MWPFYLNRTVIIRKRIRGSVADVCEVVQNVESWCRLHPLITKVEQDPANPQRYKITDRLHGPAHLWEYDSSYHAVFVPKEDEDGRGVNVSVQLPQRFLFPKLENKLRVKDTEESGVVEVLETVELRVSCAFTRFSKAWWNNLDIVGVVFPRSVHRQHDDQSTRDVYGQAGGKDRGYWVI